MIQSSPRDSDEEMDRVVLDRAQTGFHALFLLIVSHFMPSDCCTDPSGTARLSRGIEQGVVDPELRVHGANNLRVIDASVTPVIPDCQIQNAVYMIEEKEISQIRVA